MRKSDSDSDGFFLGSAADSRRSFIKKTRRNSSNGPASRLLRWSVIVLCLVTYGRMVTLVTSVTCIVVQKSNICIIPYLSPFPRKSLACRDPLPLRGAGSLHARDLPLRSGSPSTVVISLHGRYVFFHTSLASLKYYPNPPSLTST